VVEDASLGSLLVYSTGSRQHNIMLREHALRMGLSLNEYGLTDVESGELEPFADEKALYERLGLQYVPPELRQGLDEIKVAAAGKIPALVQVADLRGDLHVHTDWSDGRDEIELMIAGAKDRGYEYVAITDHSFGRGIANGLTEERLEEQANELGRIEAAVGGIRVLRGSEVDIRADGLLDYSDEVLAGLDWVVASVHSAMGQDSEVMTDRIIRAMHNPHVTAIGHLSARMIGQRGPISADFEALFRAAVDTGTALEINASPERLDLKDTHARRARELGVPLVIDSDAHMVETLDNQRYGVAVARRGWCEPEHIVNTLPLAELITFLGLEKSLRTKFIAERE
jgi:DNA polymerase (family 10)